MLTDWDATAIQWRKNMAEQKAKIARLTAENARLRVVPVDTLESIAIWLEQWAPHVEGATLRRAIKEGASTAAIGKDSPDIDSRNCLDDD